MQYTKLGRLGHQTNYTNRYQNAARTHVRTVLYMPYRPSKPGRPLTKKERDPFSMRLHSTARR